MLINKDITFSDYDELEQFDEIKVKRTPMRSRKLGWDNNYYDHGIEIYKSMNRFMEAAVNKPYDQVYSDFCKKFKPWECRVDTRQYFKSYFVGRWRRKPDFIVDDEGYIRDNDPYGPIKRTTSIPKEVVETTYMIFHEDKAKKYGIGYDELIQLFGKRAGVRIWWLDKKIHISRYNNAIYTDNADRCLKPAVDKYRKIYKLSVRYFSDNEVKQRLLKEVFEPNGYILYDVLNYNDYRARKYRKEGQDKSNKDNRILDKTTSEFWDNYNINEKSRHLKTEFNKHGLKIKLPNGLDGNIMEVNGETLDISPNKADDLIKNTYDQNELLYNIITNIKD